LCEVDVVTDKSLTNVLQCEHPRGEECWQLERIMLHAIHPYQGEVFK